MGKQQTAYLTHLHIAIPVMGEWHYLPATLRAIERQVTTYPFTVYLCVNQPDDWWEKDDKRQICEDNQQMLRELEQWKNLPLQVMDYSSRGKGWRGKRRGVGQARKVLFDEILRKGTSQDILVSLDADTLFSPNYFQAIGDFFTLTPDANVLSAPYLHPLTDDERANRSMLRYEIYMRSYLINLFLINSPYAFTALGSAIAARLEILQKIGGITPMKSGEDFYLLQKLRKMNFIHQWLAEIVYPAARFSDRVYFGTGPAMIKGDSGDWSSYPIYHHAIFQEIQQTYQLIPSLYEKDIETPFITFLQTQFNEPDLWTPLRKNSPTVAQFTKAFHEKADALRILQYAKWEQSQRETTDEEATRDNFLHFFGKIPHCIAKSFHFSTLTVDELDDIRQQLFQYEMELRKIR